MSYNELDFSRRNIVFALSEVKDMFRMHFERGCSYVAKGILEKVMAADFEGFVGAGRYVRRDGRRGYRNGYRHRRLVTTVGTIELAVPRDREAAWQPEVFERYKRVEPVVDATIRSMFLNGVSTRKVGDILDILCGSRLSASYVSKVTKELDSAVQAFANRPIEDDFIFLFLDAISVRIRVELHVKRYMLLVAYGIRSNGTRELMGFQKVKSESAGNWRAFLNNLEVRGLSGRMLKLIIMDGAAGLWAAVEEIYPLIPHQLCWVHKLRNVARHCPKRYRQECTGQAARIMYATSSAIAARQFRQWRDRWQNQAPKALRCLEKDFDKLIPFFEFPQQIRKLIRTTNVIERAFREVRRRLKIMGYFQNAASCRRIVYALFNYFNHKWHRNNEIIKTIKYMIQKAA